MIVDATLDARLLEAHAREDRERLVTLYQQASEAAAEQGHADRAAFYLTHAYVFALERGDARAPELKARLVTMGRET